MTAKERIKELTELINKYNKAYYNDNDPIVSDFEYDVLYKELQDLESLYPDFVSADSPTKRAGHKPEEKSKVIVHEQPMYSLENSYSKNDVINFFTYLTKSLKENFVVTVEPKMDGAAVSLTWNNGKLELAATRGDGKIGEDITRNAKFITNLPDKINHSGKLIVRGEVFMSKRVFQEINRQRAEDEQPLFANPRNAAAGSLKLLNEEDAKVRRLEIFIYGVDKGSKNRNHHEDIEYCHSLGLPVNPIFYKCTNIDETFHALDEIEKLRFELPYDIDGAVIKVDEYSLRDIAGYTSKFPKWALAYKYPAVQATTKLLDVVFQVGRTGAVTPVAVLSPVLLSGSTVSRASLHNESEIERLNVMINDTVFIEKGGEIIPKVIKVQEKLRPADARPIKFPTVCPVCGSLLRIDKNDAKRRCVNKNCKAIAVGSIIHFVSRNAMDIKGFGDKAVEELYDAGYLKNYADIYDLKMEYLVNRPGWGELSASNLLSAIEESKNRSFDRVLYALGLRHVGITAARLLSEHFRSIENLKNATIDEIEMVKGIGRETAESIINAFQNQDIIKTLDRLEKSGLNLKFQTIPVRPLSGKTFLITGTLDKPRKYYEDLISLNGGTVLSGVSKKLNYLIAGNEPGSKLKKAKEIGTVILTVDEFKDMLK